MIYSRSITVFYPCYPNGLIHSFTANDNLNRVTNDYCQEESRENVRNNNSGDIPHKSLLNE